MTLVNHIEQDSFKYVSNTNSIKVDKDKKKKIKLK